MLKLLSFCQMQSNWIFVKLLFMVENSTKQNCMVENGAVDVAHNWVSCYRLKIATSRTKKKKCSWKEEKTHIIIFYYTTEKSLFFCLKSNTVFQAGKNTIKINFWLLLLCSVFAFGLKSRVKVSFVVRFAHRMYGECQVTLHDTMTIFGFKRFNSG